MKFKLQILIVPDSEISFSIDSIKNFFKYDSIFPNLISINFVDLEKIEIENKDIINKDYFKLTKFLKKSDETTFSLYLRSTTITTLCPNDLVSVIYNLCDKYVNFCNEQNKFDVFYLCKWADRCDQFMVLDSLLNDKYKLVETFRPFGLQSVLFSPSGASKICEAFSESITYPMSLGISQMINSHKLYALTTFPNLMNYNVLEAIKDSDYTKTHECADPPNACGKPTPQGSNLSLFIFIIILIIVIAIFYFLIKMIGQTRDNYYSCYINSTNRNKIYS